MVICDICRDLQAKTLSACVSIRTEALFGAEAQKTGNIDRQLDICRKCFDELRAKINQGIAIGATGKFTSDDKKCHENRHFQAEGEATCECGNLVLMGNTVSEPPVSEPLIDRLTAALHANMKHPDFIYRIIPVAAIDVFDKSHWEENTEWPGASAGVDVCWRKKVGP